MNNSTAIKIESHIKGLNIAITHIGSETGADNFPVLFIHGSSFPSALSFNFRMNGESWMEYLSARGYDTYALDFLGYGNSDRYAEMQSNTAQGKPVGRAMEVYKDIDNAVNYIIQVTGKAGVHLIGHSWGGSVAALYATAFPGKIIKLVLLAALCVRNDNGEPEMIDYSYGEMTGVQRVKAMQDLTPPDRACRLEREIFDHWGSEWLKSDPLALQNNADTVRFPSGPLMDIEDLIHGRAYFNPAGIMSPTLIIRGEWDEYPDDNDSKAMFSSLHNAGSKKYVVIGKGTHVMHLEKSRYQLYDAVLDFFRRDG